MEQGVIRIKVIFLLLYNLLNAQIEVKDILIHADFINTNGYDSLGRKQGLWSEGSLGCDDSKTFYFWCFPFLEVFEELQNIADDKDDTLEKILHQNWFIVGIYKDGKKEGMWKLYFTPHKSEREKYVGDILFLHDSIVMMIAYKDRKIYWIGRGYYVERDGETPFSHCVSKEEIYFDECGRIKERIWIAEDGVLERLKFYYKDECGYEERNTNLKKRKRWN